MTKLSNGLQYFNFNFPGEFAEYLLEKGYFIDVKKNNQLFFSSEKQLLVITGKSMDLFIKAEDAQPWALQQRLHEMTFHDIYSFIRLLDSWSAIPVINSEILKPQ